MLSTSAYGAIGFLDDYLKIPRRSSGGLARRYKVGLPLIVSLIVGPVYPWFLWVAAPPGAVLALLYAAGVGRPPRQIE